jgi:hypothetical protein
MPAATHGLVRASDSERGAGTGRAAFLGLLVAVALLFPELRFRQAEIDRPDRPTPALLALGIDEADDPA